jgi:hypothetical protein
MFEGFAVAVADNDKDEDWNDNNSNHNAPALKKRRRKNKDNEYVGQRIARHFNNAYYGALVVSFKAAENEIENDLWHVRHDDGDEEDLERHEIEKGIQDFKNFGENIHTAESSQRDNEKSRGDLIYPSRVRISLSGMNTGTKSLRLSRGLVRFL